MIGKVDPASDPNSKKDPSLLGIQDPSKGKMGEMYSAKNAPGVADWFRKQWPNLSDKDLDKAVAGGMKSEMQYLQTLMKRLDKQRKKAMERARRAEEGND